MVASSATEPSGFTPVEPPRIAVAADGTLAAIAEASRAVVLELPGGAPFAEIGIDREAAANEIAWVGAPPRLLVLSRYEAHTSVHLIDPYGPRTIAEIRLEAPMKLFATVGAHALAVGSLGAAVLSASDTHLTPYQFPARGVPPVAGAAAGNFVVALGGSIEEWDPASRMPKRRLRLTKQAVITSLGGSDRVMWFVTQAEPARIEVIPLVNRGQPKSHELPEPIAQIAGHPRSDLLACVGAESGTVYVVDLDGRQGVRKLAADGVERASAAALVIGRMIGVIAGQAGKPIAIVSLDGRDVEPERVARPTPLPLPAPEPPKRSSLVDDPDEPDEGTRPSTLVDDPDDFALDEPEPPPRKLGSEHNFPPSRSVAAPSQRSGSVPARVAPPETGSAPSSPPPVEKGSDPSSPPPKLFSAWRDRMAQVPARTEPPPAPAGPSWRDELVGWARAVATGVVDRGAPLAPALDALITRFTLSPQLLPALSLLYGAHLAGERGAAPIDVARVLGRRWDEALGRGELAARGLARYVESRVILATPIQRTLDELPVASGVLVGTPGELTLLGPCVVVAGDLPLAVLATRYLTQVGGAILAAYPDADPGEVFVEARARGAAPMLRIEAGEVIGLGTDPAVLVVSSEAAADLLGVPRL